MNQDMVSWKCDVLCIKYYLSIFQSLTFCLHAIFCEVCIQIATSVFFLLNVPSNYLTLILPSAGFGGLCLLASFLSWVCGFSYFGSDKPFIGNVVLSYIHSLYSLN
jgi:hypothetical protein